MSPAIRAVCLLAVLFLCGTWAPHVARAQPPAAPAAPELAASDLAGTWAGTLSHGGESQPFALHLEPADSGRVAVRMSLPVIHLDRVPLGSPRLVARGDSIRLGPFAFRYERPGAVLHGVMPAFLVPKYRFPFALRRVERFDAPPRAAWTAPVVGPVWSIEIGSPLWAGPTWSAGTVYVGAQDGTVHAVAARGGARRWTFRTGGAVRTRPVVAGGDLYVQSDDGHLYRLDAATGTERWRVRIVDGTIERLPFDDPRSRFDRFGSDAVVVDGRVYVGTHDGRVLALDTRDGSRQWEFEAGGAVLAAPAVAEGRLVFGSYDGHVHALDPESGRELWRRDTGAAVVSTPAIAGEVVIVGNRGYDLLGLDARTGAIRWSRYIWMSWVESSATVRDGVAYVGSSDAAAVFAVDAATGGSRWTTDVRGWAWGQPAVTADRVYAGVSGQVGYVVPHEGGVVALDRATGRVVWRYPAPSPATGSYGVPGSPAVGEGFVFMGGLDGRLVALRE